MQKEKWLLLEEIPDYYPMMVVSAWNNKNASDFLKRFGFKNKFSGLLSKYKNNICGLYMPQSDYQDLADEFLAKTIGEPDWASDCINQLNKAEQETFKANQELRKISFKKLSNKQLLKTFDKYYNIYLNLHTFHWIQTIPDFGDNRFSKYLLNYLKNKVGHSMSAGEAFSVLTTPPEDSYASKEYKALLNILDYINCNSRLSKKFAELTVEELDIKLPELDKELNRKLNKHVYNFGYLGYGVSGPAWGRAYFLDILASLVKQKVKAKKSLDKLIKDKESLKAKQKKLFKVLNIHKDHQKIFKFSQQLVLTKGTRKDIMFFNYFVMERLYAEIGRRFFITVRQVRYLYPYEFKRVLLDNKLDINLLNERFKYSLHYSTGVLEKDVLLDGDAAKKFDKTQNFIKEKIGDVNILLGDCASPGKVKGETVIVNTIEDMAKMKTGNILVSIATNPNLVPAIKKAKAIITDVGGITCHAAIISRELNIPCVVGTKIATKILKDGTIVDVDAAHGKINIIKKNK